MPDLLDGSIGSDVTPPNPPAPEGWAASLPEDLRGVAEAKGWKGPEDALKSYTHLEKLISADRDGRGFLLPKDENDKEAFDKIYDTLGRPETPDGYGLGEMLAADGGDEADAQVVQALGAAMHEAGISKAQSDKLSGVLRESISAALKAQDEAFEAEVEAATREIPQAKRDAANRGLRWFGLPDDERKEVGALLVRSLGVHRAIDLMSKLGGAIGEDTPVTGGTPVGSVGDPVSAKSRMDQLMNDPMFSKRYLAGDQGAIDEIARLSKVAAGGM